MAAGSASIVNSGNTTTVTQQSGKAILNWQSFSIDRGEAVRFQQPDSHAIALNRVTGDEPSNLLGSLTANGNVWLVNPNGVFIGPSATISASGFVATTSDILDSDFLKGKYAFTRASPEVGASVVNQGLISVADTGLAALVAPQVRNDGVIVGRLGNVVLAGTPTFTLDLQGDGLIQFAVDKQAADHLGDGYGKVENGGRIAADGGAVLLTASAAADVVEDVINVDGVIEARTVAEHGGSIVLAGGDGGTVHLGGRLDASGADAGTRGGQIDMVGQRVIVDDGAVIDASGAGGGGIVRIGGDEHGGGDLRTASVTGVGETAVVSADATTRGDGGRIIVWGDDYTDVRGHVSARAGPEGGNGGWIETSSAGDMWLTPEVDTQAPRGTAGSWLIDPTDVRISNSAPNESVIRRPPVFAQDPDPIVGGPAVVRPSVLASSNSPVLIEATRDIDVVDPVSMQTDLTLDAGRTLTVANPIATTGTVSLTGQTIREVDEGRITAARLDLKAGAADSVADLRGANSVAMLSAGTDGNAGHAFADVDVFNTGALAVVGGEQGTTQAGRLSITAAAALTVAAPIQAGTAVELAAIAPNGDGNGAPFSSAAGGTLGIDAPITVSGAGGSVLLGGSRIEQNASAPITASGLGVVAMAGENGGAAEVALNANNAVDAFTFKPVNGAATPVAGVSLTNGQDLTFVDGTVGTVDFSDQPALADQIRLVVGGNLRLEKPLEGSGAGTSILVDAASFDNGVLGDQGLQPAVSQGGGRFLVYTRDPSLDVRNVSDDQFGKRYNFAFDETNAVDGIPPDRTLPANGNFFLYSVQPTLTLRIDDASRQAGQPNPPFSFQPPAGLIDNDTLSDALAGGFNSQLTTTATATSPAGSYEITFVTPPSASALGYGIVVQPGTLTVTGALPPPEMMPPATVPPPEMIPESVETAVETAETAASQPQRITEKEKLAESAQTQAHDLTSTSFTEGRQIAPIPRQRAERLGNQLYANGGNRSLWTP